MVSTVEDVGLCTNLSACLPLDMRLDTNRVGVVFSMSFLCQQAHSVLTWACPFNVILEQNGHQQNKWHNIHRFMCTCGLNNDRSSI